MTNDPDQHFRMPTRRKAEFYTPANNLKLKAGSGGLSENILSKAQDLLENNTVDFRPLGELYLEQIQQALERAKLEPDNNDVLESVLYSILMATMQLKANGGMFHYDLVTRIADRLTQFLEVIEVLDTDAIEIIKAFHTTIRAILLAQIRGDGGQRGDALLKALVDACYRYFEKHPDKKPKSA